MILFELIRKFLCALIYYSADFVPLNSPVMCMLLSVIFVISASTLITGIEALSLQVPIIAELVEALPEGTSVILYLQSFLIIGACICSWLLHARCLKLCYPLYFSRNLNCDRNRSNFFNRLFKHSHGNEVHLAGMTMTADDLKTSILVTGVTGSSKTAGVLLPALSRLLNTYNRESSDNLSKDPLQKLGAFIPEVKGDIVDNCIYLAHEAGRVVSKDILLLTPSSRLPVVRFKDEQDRYWYLVAFAGSGVSDAAELLTLHEHFFTCSENNLQSYLNSKIKFDEILKQVGAISIALGSLKPRFVGWRWKEDFLIRVSHTHKWNSPALLNNNCGECILTEPPRLLKIDGLIFIDNQVHYNIVDSNLPPAEVAERLTLLASMSKGRQKNSENEYFYDQARKLITACITLHRLVLSKTCTALEIVKLVTDYSYLEDALKLLEIKFQSCDKDDTRSKISEESLLNYFRQEWIRMIEDGKTATIIVSIITSTFDIFLQDPNLTETFCQKSTFSFEDIVQSGKIICLVPGDKYEQLGRVLGTACKIDFQSTMLARSLRSDLNSSRLALYFADECHKYVIGGSVSAGDSYFMNLSRSNNVINICATQSYAWLVDSLGRDTANVYISAFGIQFWLQQTDPETCKRAADICGTFTEETILDDQNINLSGLWNTFNSGKEIILSHKRKTDQKERFRADEFAQLNVGEVISFNKGRIGKFDKVVRGVVDYDFCTSKPNGVNAVRHRVREYYREIIENLTYESGNQQYWDNFTCN